MCLTRKHKYFLEFLTILVLVGGKGGVSQGAGIMQSKYFLKAKDKVKRPKGSPTRSRGLAPRLLGSRLYIFHMLGV